MRCMHGRIAAAGLPVVVLLALSCHSAAAQRKAARTVAADSARMAMFRDTSRSTFAPPGAREYDLRRPAQRDTLRALLRKEQALWRKSRPSAYRFLLRVSCFCPGQQGWLLIEARDGAPLRAWDRMGRNTPLTDWTTFDIDTLFANLLKSTDRSSIVLIAMDRRRHFPEYVRSVFLPGPDAWSIIEVRGFRPT